MALRETTIESGRVAGVAAGDPNITVFRGIPYAEAPVGELRWRPPVPKGKWEGVFDAARFGAICPQLLPPEGTFYHKEYFTAEYLETMSEDCLQLNVWTPARSSQERLPVLVFIHGGAFTTNYSFAPQFDGEGMAKRGIVAVTINYRVGIFGFLAHAELSKESEHGVSGNYGLQDQICALQWVRKNIAAFGGDPERITVSGGSSGGMSVQFLCDSPLTKGWIQGAIMQSGGGIGFSMCGSLGQSEEDGAEFLSSLGIKSIKEAREKTADFWVSHSPDSDRGGKMFLRPCVDGYLLLQAPGECEKAGKHADISYMIGCSADEAGSMKSRFKAEAESVRRSIQGEFGKEAERYLSLFKLETPEDAYDYLLNHDMTERAYASGIAWCELQNALGRKPSYMYRMKRKLPGDDAGAFHSCEHWYVFQTLQRCWRPFEGVDYELSDKMADYWANFVKTGNPNSGESIEWEPYTSERPCYMAFDVVCQMETVERSPLVDFRVKMFLGNE